MTIMESGLGLRGNQRKTTSLKDSYVDLFKGLITETQRHCYQDPEDKIGHCSLTLLRHKVSKVPDHLSNKKLFLYFIKHWEILQK